jgi:hypothetical protein
MVGFSLSDARNLCGRRREYIGFGPDRTRAAPAPFERPGWIFHARIISTLEPRLMGRGLRKLTGVELGCEQE